MNWKLLHWNKCTFRHIFQKPQQFGEQRRILGVFFENSDSWFIAASMTRKEIYAYLIIDKGVNDLPDHFDLQSPWPILTTVNSIRLCIMFLNSSSLSISLSNFNSWIVFRFDPWPFNKVFQSLTFQSRIIISWSFSFWL